MTIGSLGYLGLKVKDPDAWRDFATGVLGMMPGESANGAQRFRLDEQAWRIAVEPGDADDVDYLGFEVAGAAELDAVARRLAEGGVAVGNGDPALIAERGVLGLVSCQDPDGLKLEIYYGATLRTETPFVSPAGVASFVTGAQGLGHAVISTRDIVAARHFYQDLLGFRLSDTIRMRMGANASFELEFYHCNPRHHTLALLPIPTPKRLHHFMLQVPTLDAVGFALERAQAAGTPTRLRASRSNSASARWRWTTPPGA
jgi:2,3-dihydroxybiphenyl 1,2-dioxygenase